MRTIRLYGSLRKFGREFTLDVRTPAEAIRALCCQLKGFRQFIEKHSEPGYVVKVGEEERGSEELQHPCARQEVIKLIPYVAGGNATTRIIIGAILIAAVTIASSGTLTPMTATMLMSTGASLVLGGIAELLAPSPKSLSSNNKAYQPSYLFDGPVNTVGSGYAVSVGYGQMLIGSHVISAEMYSVEEVVSAA